MLRDHEYAVRLAVTWLNERHARNFNLDPSDNDMFRASDAEAGAMTIVCADLYEADTTWDERRAAIAQRLDESRPGSYVLWVPPGGELPNGEPDESEFVRRVVLAASKLASGRSGEVRLTVRLMLGKLREEGGYASVTGGLGRYWTEISARTNGSFYLDSRGLNRFTRNEEERTQLYDHIGLLSQGMNVGDATEFEHEDAWSIQRLPRLDGLSDGWAITGCPPAFSPEDGGAIRRLLRRRLSDAAQQLGGAEGVRVLVLVGAYEYMEWENAGPSLRGFDPSLSAAFDLIILVSDAEVKALRATRLPFAKQEAAT